MTEKELKGYYDIFQKELTDNILAFWTTHVVDRSSESFHGAVDRMGHPDLTGVEGMCVIYTNSVDLFSECKNTEESSICRTCRQVLSCHYPAFQ